MGYIITDRSCLSHLRSTLGSTLTFSIALGGKVQLLKMFRWFFIYREWDTQHDCTITLMSIESSFRYTEPFANVPSMICCIANCGHPKWPHGRNTYFSSPSIQTRHNFWSFNCLFSLINCSENGCSLDILVEMTCMRSKPFQKMFLNTQCRLKILTILQILTMLYISMENCTNIGICWTARAN